LPISQGKCNCICNFRKIYLFFANVFSINLSLLHIFYLSKFVYALLETSTYLYLRTYLYLLMYFA
jgi:hypothetical protein